jgi:hypothetical protein
MRKRDWAGTVLVPCLIAAAGLLRDHTVLLALLGTVASVCVLVIVWDVSGERAVSKQDASALTDALTDEGAAPQMSNIDRMNLIATKQAERAAERMAQEPLLADRLASLYGAFRELREKVKPERGPSYRLIRHALKQPIEVVLEQREAERLDGAVRRLLVEQAQRFVPDWDEAASLPPNDERSPGIPMLTADAKQVAAFLDAKIVVLRRVIQELREGR